MRSAPSSPPRILALALALALPAIAAVTATTRDAAACELGYCIEETVPEDGASDVPTDARLWVFYNTTPGTPPDLELIIADTGDVVATQIEDVSGGTPLDEVPRRVAVVAPAEPLQPLTGYELRIDGIDACGADAVAFVTGDQPLDDAPETVSGVSASASCEIRPPTPNDCEDQNVYPRLAISVDGVGDEAAVAHAMYQDDELLALGAELPLRHQLEIEDASGTACFEVRSLGMGGAEGAPSTPACVELDAVTCRERTPPDGGPGQDAGPSDASTLDGGGSSTTSSTGGGCAVARGPGGSPGLLAIVALALLGCWWTRSSPARSKTLSATTGWSSRCRPRRSSFARRWSPRRGRSVSRR